MAIFYITVYQYINNNVWLTIRHERDVVIKQHTENILHGSKKKAAFYKAAF
jgi:hypothetical protein